MSDLPTNPPWVLAPREPGSCELDDSGWLLTFMHELHAGVPDHPIMGWSDFDDEQRARIQSAYRAMIAALPAPPMHPAADALGAWMSAALDDAETCEAMKADINAWFAAGQPVPMFAPSPIAPEALDRLAALTANPLFICRMNGKEAEEFTADLRALLKAVGR